MKKKLITEIVLILLFAIFAGYWAFKPVKQGLDLKGGVYVVLLAEPQDEKELKPGDMDKFIAVLEKRINAMGTAESRVQQSGANRVIVEIPDLKDTEKAVEIIGTTALLEFQLFDEENENKLKKTGLTGKDLESAKVGYDQFGKPQIEFKLNINGADKFAKLTRENKGKRLAITLDGKVQTAPYIRSEIAGGAGVISGDYTIKEATDVTTLLNAGALPLKATILETRSVGATLGKESIDKSVYAAKIALLMIVIFMVLWYRIPGIIATVALAVFGLLSYGTLNYFDATLTLPGIAGLILSLGMAVDANVIIFERIKDELKAGNSVLKSVEAGFQKAFSAILDSNITTLIMTAILFTLGTGPVKGFAVTLSIGTLASMFTAITVTRLLLKGAVVIFGLKSTKAFGVKGAK